MCLIFLLVESLQDFKEKKESWIKENQALRFSAGITLTDDEIRADEKLEVLRKEVVTSKFNPTIHNFYDQMVSLPLIPFLSDQFAES